MGRALIRRVGRLVATSAKAVLGVSIVKLLRYLKVETKIPDDLSLTVHRVLNDRAAVSSGDYIEKHLHAALMFLTRERLWDFSLSRALPTALFAEFGVYSGASINHFAK